MTLSQVVELNKRFLQGYLHFKDQPKVQKLRDDVLRYNRFLRDLGLRDHQVFKLLKVTSMDILTGRCRFPKPRRWGGKRLVS